MARKPPIPSLSRELCKICYHVNPVGFSVPDRIWRAAVPVKFRNNVVCITCFQRLADEKLIPWDDEIEFWPVSMASFVKFVQVGD